jgi:putative nucleotidyltransferase with HDIG domain
LGEKYGQYGAKMQKIFIDGVAPGAIIAEDVYGMDGVLLVKRGTMFREQYITRFREAGIQEIFIEPDGSLSPETVKKIHRSLNIQDVIHEKTRIHAQAQIKKTMMRFRSVSNGDIYKIGKIVENMIEQLLEQRDFVFALSQLRSVDDYTYQHSVNVGVLSMVIGIELGFKKSELKNLGMGAMLHDIGKIMVPESILKKPSKLTLEEFMEAKKHAQYGYDILSQTDMPEEAALIALYHHEKYNGTGYLEGLKGTEIPIFARIAAVADVYDAMSNDRVYQKKSSPDKVFREITHLGDLHFDAQVMEAFAKHISIYPTGTGVILNSGHRGIVLHQNKLYPESPKIRVFTPQHGNLKRMYFDVDLSLNTKWYIVDTFT